MYDYSKKPQSRYERFDRDDNGECCICIDAKIGLKFIGLFVFYCLVDSIIQMFYALGNGIGFYGALMLLHTVIYLYGFALYFPWYQNDN